MEMMILVKILLYGCVGLWLLATVLNAVGGGDDD